MPAWKDSTFMWNITNTNEWKSKTSLKMSKTSALIHYFGSYLMLEDNFCTRYVMSHVQDISKNRDAEHILKC